MAQCWARPDPHLDPAVDEVNEKKTMSQFISKICVGNPVLQHKRIPVPCKDTMQCRACHANTQCAMQRLYARSCGSCCAAAHVAGQIMLFSMTSRLKRVPKYIYV